MNRILIIIILTFVLTSCITKTTADKDFNLPPTLENLADKDTLFIEACIHHHCGGEWGGCLEWNKIYRQPNGYGVTFINGMTVWNGDTIIDPKKTKTISKTLTDSDIKHVDDFLHQVNIFSDSLSLTSNGPNYYIIKTKNYKKTIVQDYDQWLHYQRLTDNIYK